MLSKKYHLPKSFFLKKQEKILQSNSESFLVKVYLSPLAYSRIAVVVSAKIVQKATQRNGLKRTFFEFIRKNGYFSEENRDFVFILRPGAGTKTKQEIENELGLFWKK